MSMEIKNYAPVIIPTLNRFDHLKKCLESLNKCHNADKTEVFISVDFPPTEKYKEGHCKICQYLDNADFNFKELHVYKQKKNLGVANGGDNKYDNISFLKETISKEYDRWIFSEDDNVFAPAFLDFVNEGLERFKDDPTVYSICGYNFYYNIKFGANNYYRQNSDFNAWGHGVWREKVEKVSRIDVSYLRKIVYNPIKVLKIWSVSNLKIYHLAGYSQQRYFKKADNFLTLYMIDNDMCQIMPVKSLVRNIGWDDSGVHCTGFDEKVINRHINQEMDESPFCGELIGSGWEFFQDNRRIIRDEDFQRISFLHALYSYLKRFVAFWQ